MKLSCQLTKGIQYNFRRFHLIVLYGFVGKRKKRKTNLKLKNQNKKWMKKKIVQHRQIIFLKILVVALEEAQRHIGMSSVSGTKDHQFKHG